MRSLPLSMWLRHPLVAASATFLAQGDEHGELAHEVNSLTRAAKLVDRRSRRLGRWSRKACRAAGAAATHYAAAAAADDKVRVMGGSGHTTAARGWAITAREARPMLADTLRRIDEEVAAGITAHHQSRSRVVTVIAYLLLAVDAVALFTVFGLLLNIDWTNPAPAPLITAVAFSLFGAGVQAKLAMELGRRMWTWRLARQDGPIVGWSVVLLFTVSVFAALSILLRVRHEGELVGEAGVATVVGLALAGCAIAAPWIIVQQEAYDGTPLTRRAAALSRVVDRAARNHDRCLRRADRSIARALSLERRGSREYARVVTRIGRYYVPAHRTILLARDLVAHPTHDSRVAETARGRSGALPGAPRMGRAHIEPLAVAAVPGPPPAPDAPRSALPIRLPVDLGALTTPLAQARSAIEAAHGRPAVEPPESRLGKLSRVARGR
ncbi:hypothetical protein [Actinokineospora inagensis]|uniref:hypothetical protein n=1 Tax=Actinokineospora inagensis TaxID=103730 RepID=UPI00040B54D5|nr:hypothetical protein [Actinokineospora inagensis]